MYRGSLVQSLFFENQTGHCRPVFNSASYLLLQFFLSFRFKVEQWLILAILVFVLVILFARVCRVISRSLCHDTLSCYCGTIVIWIHRAELSLFSSILPYLWLWVYLSDPVAFWVRPVHSLASLNFAGLATFH